MFPADAAAFIADTGESVTWISSAADPKPSGLMLFDLPDAGLESGEIISRQYLVTFETAAWVGLKREDQLVIGGAGFGATYKLRTDPMKLDDGVFSNVKLTRVSA